VLQLHDVISRRAAFAADPVLDLPGTRPAHERIANGAYLLRGFALD
jgi:hypothetical protein